MSDEPLRDLSQSLGISPEELKRMFQASGKVYAERAVLDRPVGDFIDSKTFKVFYESKYNEAVSDEEDEMLRLLENVELAKEAQIKRGIRRTRNTILASFAFDVLPYRGIGSGVLRALQAYPKIDFKNDIEGEQFVVTIPRPEIKK
jgi:predicted HTH transcriptional regulator